MVGGSSASQPAPPCSPDEWHRRPFLLQSARLIWAYVPVTHILSHASMALTFLHRCSACLFAGWCIPVDGGSTLEAGVVHPGAVD